MEATILYWGFTGIMENEMDPENHLHPFLISGSPSLG